VSHCLGAPRADASYAATPDGLVVIEGGARPRTGNVGVRILDVAEGKPRWKAECRPLPGRGHAARDGARAAAGGLRRYEVPVGSGVVFVTSWERQLGFDLVSGRRSWATNEFNNVTYVRPSSQVFLTQGSRFVPERRDVRTRQVIATYPTERVRLREPVVLGDDGLFQARDIPDTGSGDGRANGDRLGSRVLQLA